MPAKSDRANSARRAIPRLVHNNRLIVDAAIDRFRTITPGPLAYIALSGNSKSRASAASHVLAALWPMH